MRKSLKIPDVVAHFKDWYFRIDPHHYGTIGATYKLFHKNKVPYWSWAITIPPEYDLNPGYIFYAQNNQSHYLQVLAQWDAFRIEVHEGHFESTGSRLAFAVSEDDFVRWLKTGVRPQNCIELDTANSKAGLLAWRIKPVSDAITDQQTVDEGSSK